MFQHTLANAVSCIGITLHSGDKVYMTLQPAPENTGIVFKRTDVHDRPSTVPADFRNVVNTTLNTTIANRSGVKVATIEHLMAAFWGCGIDNAIVELDGQEVPIMDGSAEPFVFLIECAGIRQQSAHRRIIEVLKPISVTEEGKRVSIVPAENFSVSLEIDFGNSFVSHQNWEFKASDASFKTDISRARTFGFAHEVEKLRAQGLARGGSLDNAIVVNGTKILNEGGLRYGDEFVRHKILDCIGDLYLVGGHLRGRVEGRCSGHTLNNRILHRLFEDNSAWQLVDDSQMVPLSEAPALRAYA